MLQHPTLLIGLVMTALSTPLEEAYRSLLQADHSEDRSYFLILYMQAFASSFVDILEALTCRNPNSLSK